MHQRSPRKPEINHLRITPPVNLESPFWILNDKKYYNHCDCYTSIKCSRQDIIVTHPPSEAIPSDEVVEGETRDGPRCVIDATAGWDSTNTSKEDGDVDVSPKGKRISLGKEIEGNGEGGTDEEPPKERGVSFSWAKQACRTDATPDEGGGREGIRRGTDETILLLTSANVRDIAEHPFLDADCNKARYDGCNDLDTKHGAGWDFHVMAKLEVARKTNCLIGTNESDRLEKDVCDGTTRKHVSGDELMHDLQGNLLIGNSHKHRKGNREDGSEDKGNQDGPDGKMSRMNFNCDHNKDQRDNTDNAVPPHGNFWIVLHQARVDIAFIFECTAESAHNVATEPNYDSKSDQRNNMKNEFPLTESMHKDGSE